MNRALQLSEFKTASCRDVTVPTRSMTMYIYIYMILCIYIYMILYAWIYIYIYIILYYIHIYIYIYIVCIIQNVLERILLCLIGMMNHDDSIMIPRIIA